MTCIAWKKGVVAADSRCTWEDGKYELSDKLFRVPKGVHKGHIVGTTGADSPGMVFFDWYCDPKKENKPVLKFEDEAFTCVIFTPDGVFTADDHCRLLPVHEPYGAMGSGADFAIGAMDKGASAIDAVRIACRHNAFCGPPIKSMLIPLRKK